MESFGYDTNFSDLGISVHLAATCGTQMGNVARISSVATVNKLKYATNQGGLLTTLLFCNALRAMGK